MIYLFINRPIWQSMILSINQSIYLSINLTTYASVYHPSIHPSFHPSIHPSFHPFVYVANYSAKNKHTYRTVYTHLADNVWCVFTLQKFIEKFICHVIILHNYYTIVVHCLLHTVDGCEVQHQLICGKHPMFYRVSTFQGAAGWEPLPNSTFQGFQCADGGACYAYWATTRCQLRNI